MYTKLLKLSFQPLEKNRTELKLKHVKIENLRRMSKSYEIVPKGLWRRWRQHEFHNSCIKIVLTRQPCSNLYISCNLLLHKLVNFLLSNRFSYIEFQSQKTALNPRSFTCSSFLQSELLQKCQNNPQYVRYGNIAALYIFNLGLFGINFRDLTFPLT